MPKFPRAVVRLSEVAGVPYAVVGATAKAMRECGATAAEVSEFTKEAVSGDYDRLVETVRKWVTVT